MCLLLSDDAISFVHITTIAADVVESLLCFMYTGCVAIPVSTLEK